MDAPVILIVEDDPDINALLAKIMVREGFCVVQAFSGTEALLQVEHAAFDLVLLDMMLPGVDGRAVVARLREGLSAGTGAAPCVPVIVVSAKTGLADKVDMLRLGADDYVTKPFEPDEVAARVHAVLRRGSAVPGVQEEDETYIHRGLRLDVARRRVDLNGAEVSLTAHEFDILRTLMQAPDKVFSRERLYELVWKGGYYGEDNAINVHVSNIRKKLAAVDPGEEHIKTVWGIGFKLA